MKQREGPDHFIWDVLKILILLFLLLAALTVVNHFTYEMDDNLEKPAYEQQQSGPKGIILYQRGGKIVKTEKENNS
ncbi:MAG: hypothetical protein JRH18_12690 [Deltaproteobacteria bacterium]|nr:hypothetical protein [Deltaproteobacteria bacterium]MBW1961354.1 hypothetical protein [Deltaproteobacteria bacterium]MBW2152514.1 hypothetical protein [Deltaproteobacteria bacterium]